MKYNISYDIHVEESFKGSKDDLEKLRDPNLIQEIGRAFQEYFKADQVSISNYVVLTKESE